MISVGFLGLFMVAYGPQTSLHFFSLHLCRIWNLHDFASFLSLRSGDIGSGQAGAMFGAHTYTWGIFRILGSSGGDEARLLLFVRKDSPIMADIAETRNVIKPFTPFGKIVVLLTFIVYFL